MSWHGQRNNDPEEKFILRNDILFTVDRKQIVVADRSKGTSTIITYPDAAIWSVLIENHNRPEAILILQAIMNKSKAETLKMIDRCLATWRESGLIE